MMRLIGVSLIGTLGVGVLLRLWLSGALQVHHDFAALRHLHTHLGYYGVLFPLMWMCWREQGVAAPGRRMLILYGAATLLSAAGFAHSGYGPVAIAGSTVVLGVWVASAWRARSVVRGRSWLATVPLGVLLGAALVPGVAASAGTPQAGVLVRSFLGMLMLGALLPSALARIGARPPGRVVWLLAATAGAVSLGAWPSAPLRAGLLVIGVLIGVAASSAERAPADLRASWLIGAAGLAGAGLGAFEITHLRAVSGTHFLILGPLLLSLWPQPLPAWSRVLGLVSLGGMCLAILWPHPTATAGFGILLALQWSVWALGAVWGTTSGRAISPRGAGEGKEGGG